MTPKKFACQFKSRGWGSYIKWPPRNLHVSSNQEGGGLTLSVLLCSLCYGMTLSKATSCRLFLKLKVWRTEFIVRCLCLLLLIFLLVFLTCKFECSCVFLGSCKVQYLNCGVAMTPVLQVWPTSIASTWPTASESFIVMWVHSGFSHWPPHAPTPFFLNCCIWVHSGVLHAHTLTHTQTHMI